jgi:hypothetical protein
MKIMLNLPDKDSVYYQADYVNSDQKSAKIGTLPIVDWCAGRPD